eukprot:COSAG02_NODE_5466_length_4299_cov_5.037857_4_plen_592_part_00
MTGIEAGKTWSRVGPEVAPTSSSASGVFTLQEYSENQANWPQPTVGHWAFVGDPDASGQAANYYSEGGLFQTAAQASAGNNEHTIIARVTDNTGITGSGAAIIQGLRINGNAPLSGTATYNKGIWWQYSDGISFNALGNVWYEDSSGNFYLAIHGYVGSSFNPPRYHSRIMKFNSSMVLQWSQSYSNNPTANQGCQYPVLEEVNGDVCAFFQVNVAQAGGSVRPLMGLAEVNTSNGALSGQARMVGMGFSYSFDQLQAQSMIWKNKNPGTGNSSAFFCCRNYMSTYSGFPGGGYTIPANSQVVQIGEMSYNGSSWTNSYLLSNTWYNRSSTSSGRYDLYPTDFDTKDNTNQTFTLAYGGAQSVVDTSTKNFAVFGEYVIGASEGSADSWILKFQTGGKNTSVVASGMCMDIANSCIYLHGYATDIGASNTALNSLWIGKFPCNSDGIPTGAISWINSYCSESYSVYPKTGRNGLKLTPNNTITSFGYTQTTSGSGTPAITYLVTVPTDGSAVGGSGSVDGISVTSHDISSFALWQYVTVSANVDVRFSTSGTANISSTSVSYVSEETSGVTGTTNATMLVPNPTEYANGGI